MKPRQCKCGCYVADQFKRCPKCGAKVKMPTAVDTKEDHAREDAARLERLNRDAKVLNATKLKWVLPKAGQLAQRETYQHLRKRLKQGDRNVRSHLRVSKAIALASRAGRWTWEYPPKRYNEKNEIIITRGPYLPILISPKGNRYVAAHPNERADLILDYGRVVGFPAGVSIRLRRWAKSSMAKTQKKLDHEVKARAKARKDKKKARHEKKKLMKRLAT